LLKLSPLELSLTANLGALVPYPLVVTRSITVKWS
jgi:hypothetical protein